MIVEIVFLLLLTFKLAGLATGWLAAVTYLGLFGYYVITSLVVIGSVFLIALLVALYRRRANKR